MLTASFHVLGEDALDDAQLGRAVVAVHQHAQPLHHLALNLARQALDALLAVHHALLRQAALLEVRTVQQLVDATRLFGVEVHLDLVHRVALVELERVEPSAAAR